MIDLEAAVAHQPQDTMSQQIRHRKNVTTSGPNPMNMSSSDNLPKEHMRSNQYLVQQINRASKMDDDDDELMKKAMIRHQDEANKRMAKGLLNLMLFLAVFVFLLYLFATNGSSDEESQSALAKSLGILLGLRKRSVINLPKSKKIVASISFMKTELSQYLYPSWPWSYSSNNSQYLIPNSGKGASINNILHRVTQLKKLNNLDVVLYDPKDIESFLASEKGKKCSLVSGNQQKIILEQYHLYGNHGAKEAQKMLWMWCLLYTNEAQGFLDLDSFEVQLGHGLISSLATNQIQNLVMDSNTIQTRNGETISPSLVTSLLFLLDSTSHVPQKMLEYFLETSTLSDLSRDNLLKDSILRMNDSIATEKEKWTLPKTDCIEQKEYFPLADVCDNVMLCCQLIRPRISP
mmetsp:Transcript_7433/g.14059  ORF Transcript_7433/g.14059 Transcript_7433/m.14059 type:complete len:405 (-) Transcript_7433:1283-2497(-)